jgi:uncharacterized membrane protein
VCYLVSSLKKHPHRYLYYHGTALISLWPKAIGGQVFALGHVMSQGDGLMVLVTDLDMGEGFIGWNIRTIWGLQRCSYSMLNSANYYGTATVGQKSI